MRGQVAARVLVRFRDACGAAERAAAHAATACRLLHRFRIPAGLELVSVPPGRRVDDVVRAYQRDPRVRYAEPDALATLAAVPNDPRFPDQWGLEATGQFNGTPDLDLNAPLAWDLTTGSRHTIIGIIDSGIDYAHPDLAANVWTNPGEIAGNGVDDDQNGYVDDMHGINALTGSGDPLDDFGHGTHVAGIVGAVGDNGEGIAGVNWAVQLIAIKAFDSQGRGSSSTSLLGLEYLWELKTRVRHPVDVIVSNNSYQGGFSQAYQDALTAHREAGIVFVAASGNAFPPRDNDRVTHYPSGYRGTHVLAVTAHTQIGTRFGPGNFGRRSVDLGAPSFSWSTWPPATYRIMAGTSMAAPVVTGLVGLLRSQDPTRDWRALKNLVLAGSVPAPRLEGLTLTGRRVRAADLGGAGSLTCSGQVLLLRTRPVPDALWITLGAELPLAMLHIDCAQPNGAVDVSLGGGSALTLLDGGQGVDEAAGDGVYSRGYRPTRLGLERLGFPDGSEVEVRAVQGYRAPQVVPYDFRVISGSSLGLGDDAVASVAAPWSLSFAGVPGAFAEVLVSSNGLLGFEDLTSSAANRPLPLAGSQRLLAPFWDDLNPAAGGDVVHAVLGSAPQRELVIEWRDVPHFHSGGAVTFQVVLFEDNSDLLVNYRDVVFGDPQSDAGRGATVGVQVGLDAAHQFSFGEALLADGLALRWAVNRAPFADAGPDRVVERREEVRLSGSGGDPEGGLLSYSWVQTAGTPVTIAEPDRPDLGFQAPELPGNLEFELSVHDDEGLVGRDRIALLVENGPPSLAAFSASPPRAVPGGALVRLAFPWSDPTPGEQVQVRVDWGEGSVETLAAGAQEATHVYTAAGTYQVRLELEDSLGARAADQAQVLVRDEDLQPAPAPPRRGSSCALGGDARPGAAAALFALLLVLGAGRLRTRETP